MPSPDLSGPSANGRDATEQVLPSDIPAPPSNRGGVTWRSALLALLLVPIHCYWITLFEVRWYSLDSTSLPLMITPIFILFCVVLLNMPLRRWSSRHALEQGELLTVYIVMVISGVFASHDMIQNLFGAIGHAVWFARPENRWEELWFRYIPWHLFVKDKAALRPYYQGNSNPWTPQIMAAWIGPLLWWAIFMTALVLIFLGVNLILRRQWTQNERLTFPLVQLPIAMTAERDGLNFFRNRLMWMGFGLAFGIGTLNGLGTLYPSVPYLSMVKLYDVGRYVSEPPWSAIGGTNISMYPFAIGLGYFIPLDLSFSCWFFFVARKLWQVFGRVAGLDSGPANQGFPYFGEQSSGAWLTLSLVLAWGMRGYFRDTIKMARLGPDADDPDEARRMRWAYGMILAGLAGVFAFWTSTGLSLWVMALYMGIYFLLSLTITRVRAELGTPHEINFVRPQQIMADFIGARNLSALDLTVVNSTYWMHRGYRSHPMPAQLEAFKMAENRRININRLVWLTIAASVVSIVATYWANLHITYEAGAQGRALGFKSWVGSESFDRLTSYMLNKEPINATKLFYYGAGSLVTVGLAVMRAKFLWWPFHPAGYALAVSYALDYFWFAFFVAWVLKALLIRYGGMKMHNAFVPFFLGLILGDFVIGSVWAIVGPLLGVQAYKIYI